MVKKARHVELRTVLFADLVGYSRLVSVAEDATLEFMERAFVHFGEWAAGFGGSLVKTTGDGVVVEFASPSQAVRYAIAMHKAMAELPCELADRPKFRMGIHLGEVERTDKDIYGHAVNIAARLQEMAKAGGTCVSHDVYHLAHRSTPFHFVAAGLKQLKNIPDAVAIYHVVDRQADVAAKPTNGFLSMSIIGGLSITAPSGASALLRSNHVRGLFGYLALSPQYTAQQDRVAAMLWPEIPVANARRALAGCLRSATHTLDALASRTLFRRHGELGFEAGRLRVDLVELHRDLSLGVIDEMLFERADWPESILSGTETISGLYRSWLDVTRHSWRVKVADALEACLLRLDAKDQGTRRAASALLLLEPSHEKAVQRLMQHHAAQGNVALALSVFTEFADQLKSRYGITPSSETLELSQKLSSRQSVRPARAPGIPEPARPPRVMIGEFTADRSVMMEEHLVAGFRSELVANLSRFRDWIVLEAAAATGRSPQAIQPDYLLSTRCGKTHSELSLFATLSEPATARIVWSDTFSISPETWSSTQRLLVKQIAARLEVYLSSDRVSRLITEHDSNRSAYNDWLYGEHLLSLWKPEAEDEAAELFERIIERDSAFAPAHASLAGIFNVRHLIRPGSPLDANRDKQALTLGQRAVELDPLDAKNHLTVAWSLAMSGAHEQAAVHYELAVSLNPASPRLLISCAQGLAFVGAGARAGELLVEIFRVAPFLQAVQWCYIASTRYMIDDDEGTVDAAMRGGNATLDTPGWRAAALVRLDRIEEARAAFAELVEVVSQEWAGDDEASPAAVASWFLSAFPIAGKARRETLQQAMRLLSRS